MRINFSKIKAKKDKFNVPYNTEFLVEKTKEPIYAQEGDAGADLCWVPDVLRQEKQTYTLKPGERHLFGTNLSFEIPLGYVGLIHSRSGLANKNGVIVLNAPGVVDSGYRGEVMVNLINLSREEQTINAGDRIAQIIIQKFESVEFVEQNVLSESIRGTNGHGSTGTS